MSTLSTAPRGSRPLVVVADQVVEHRTMLGFVLHHRGFDVVFTANGRDAFDAVLVHHPDAVVSDLDMPHLDGLGFCRAVRALRPADSLPVILWSSADDTDPRLREAIALGGVQFLSKSMSLAEIGAVLRQILCPDEVEIAS